MFRNAAVIVCVGLAAAWPARAADDLLVGRWQVNHDGYSESLTITKDKDSGEWSAAGTFRQKGQEVGSWNGADVSVADGVLTCTQTWVQKPNPTWGDDQKVTAKVKGGKLVFAWDAGGAGSGTREMVRAKAAAADGSDLIGTWKVDHDGYVEAWEIRMDNGKWAVKGVFLKKGRQVGAWVGTDPAFGDGKLICTQKYIKKPEESWTDGATLTARMNNDKLDFTWDDNNGQSGTREMTKAGK